MITSGKNVVVVENRRHCSDVGGWCWWLWCDGYGSFPSYSVMSRNNWPESPLTKHHTALSYHGVREAIAAKVFSFYHIPGVKNSAAWPANIGVTPRCGLSFAQSYRLPLRLIRFLPFLSHDGSMGSSVVVNHRLLPSMLLLLFLWSKRQGRRSSTLLRWLLWKR